jgi:hypothetical protein
MAALTCPDPVGHEVEMLVDLAEPLVIAELTGQPAICAIEGRRPGLPESMSRS